MNWEQVVVTLLPYAATAAISVYAIRNSRQLKELEIKDNERGRIFELQKAVTEKAIEAVVEASFRLGRQANQCAAFLSERRTECDPILYDQLKDDLSFIAHNKPFFPNALREDIHGASSRLTHIMEARDNNDLSFRVKVFTEAIPAVQKAKKATEQFLDQYNLFNDK